MNPNDPMDLLTKDASDRLERKERDLIDQAIIGGATDAASLLDNDEVKQRLGQVAFMEAVAAQNADIKPPPRPGPARRAKKLPTKRQRVKAARKRNR